MRLATQSERRLEECTKLGIRTVVVPADTSTSLRGERGRLPLVEAPTLRHAVQRALVGKGGDARPTERRRIGEDASGWDGRLHEAIARVAPGTSLRQGIDDIIRSHEGALIVIGHPDELSFLYSGGIRIDQPFTPQLVYELAKMDGAIVVDETLTRIAYANVQLLPDPTIPSAETGMRHRTAERVAKQTGVLVVSISQQRETVTIFVGPGALPARSDASRCSRRRTRRWRRSRRTADASTRC